jgi:hypothetical protein
MGREGQPISAAAQARDYTFHFQITNKGGRQACSVRVLAPNIVDATTFVRKNWPLIESRAREELARRFSDEGGIKLAVPLRTITGDAENADQPCFGVALT